MDKNFAIVTDSGSDISVKRAEEWNVTVCPMLFSVNGQEPVYDMGIDMEKFYKSIKNGEPTKTSAINIQYAYDKLEILVRQSLDILIIAFSSGLSSTCKNFHLAAADIKEKYPSAKILIVDSLCASLGQALLVYQAVQLKNEGKSIDEVHSYLENNKLKLCHIFTVDDLFFLKRGGRVSSAAAVIGSALAIKPILHVDNEGHLIPIGKARGRKASMNELCKNMAENAVNIKEQTVFICHGGCIDDANTLAEIIKSKLSPKDIIIDYVGPVIGSHSGPGTLSVFFMGSQR